LPADAPFACKKVKVNRGLDYDSPIFQLFLFPEQTIRNYRRMSLKDFFTSRVFFKQLALAVAITLAIVLVALFSLKIYTRHGEANPVPDLTGMTEEEFAPVLKKSRLRFEIVDSAYQEAVQAGGVVKQFPGVGHKVKKNRTIFLTINSRLPEQVVLPKLTDISFRQALVQLENAGLQAGNISYQPSEFHNLVLKATLDGLEIVQGEKVNKGTKIDLVVGSGEGVGKVQVPLLKGLSVLEARVVVSEAMLNIGAVVFDESVVTKEDSLNARIWQQSPDPLATPETDMGTSVDLWVTVDEAKLQGNTETESESEIVF